MTDKPTVTDAVREQARVWFSLQQSGDITAEQQDALTRWRQQSPEHEQAWQELEQIWSLSAHISPSHVQQVLRSIEPPPRPARRWFLKGAVAGGAVAAVGTMVWGGALWESLQYEAVLQTRLGEQQQMELQDGSVLLLNTDTRAHVRFYASERRVTLDQGEVFFAVSADAARPFRIDTPQGRVEVTGTRFNVRVDQQHMRVVVESGSVQVSSGPWWATQRQSLSAGQGVEAESGKVALSLPEQSLDNALAWQRGKIVIDDLPLEQALAEINRYLPIPARLMSPTWKLYRVSGVFSIQDPQSFIEILPALAPVQVIHLPDGQVRILDR
ncbi:MAG: FecR family protein [Alcaligenes sp.]